MWTRKPPHHLPPLDSSDFQRKSKPSKSCGKKDKRRKNRETKMAVATELQENSGTEPKENSSTAIERRGSWEEHASFLNSDSSFIRKQPKVAGKNVVEKSKGTNFEHENEMPFVQEKLIRPTVSDNKKSATVVPLVRERRIARHISPFLEVLPSKKTVHAISFPGQSLNTGKVESEVLPRQVFNNESNERRRSSSTSSSKEITTQNAGLKNFDEKPVRVQNVVNYRYEFPVYHSNRGKDNSSERLWGRPRLHSDRQQPTRSQTEESYSSGVIRRSSSQPNLSQPALYRDRRAGVCKETANMASTNDRLRRARVFMKKFGKCNPLES